MFTHFGFILFEGPIVGDILEEMQHEQRDAAVCGLSSQSGSGYRVLQCLCVCEP